MARRTLQQFVSGLEARVSRLAVHVGEQRGPALVGDVVLEPYRQEGGGLDVAAVVARVEAVADAAGWPETSPSLAVRAYTAEDGKRPTDTYQQTSTGWERAATSGPTDRRDVAFEKLLESNLEYARIIQGTVKNLTDALASERNYATDRAREASETRETLAEVEAANTLLEGAVENHQKSDELEVRLRGFELAEKAMDTALAGKMSPAALKAYAAKNPAKFAELKAALKSDPDFLALLMT